MTTNSVIHPVVTLYLLKPSLKMLNLTPLLYFNKRKINNIPSITYVSRIATFQCTIPWADDVFHNFMKKILFSWKWCPTFVKLQSARHPQLKICEKNALKTFKNFKLLLSLIYSNGKATSSWHSKVIPIIDPMELKICPVQTRTFREVLHARQTKLGLKQTGSVWLWRIK